MSEGARAEIIALLTEHGYVHRQRIVNLTEGAAYAMRELIAEGILEEDRDGVRLAPVPEPESQRATSVVHSPASRRKEFQEAALTELEDGMTQRAMIFAILSVGEALAHG